jgi:hypothetical protein
MKMYKFYDNFSNSLNFINNSLILIVILQMLISYSYVIIRISILNKVKDYVIMY